MKKSTWIIMISAVGILVAFSLAAYFSTDRYDYGNPADLCFMPQGKVGKLKIGELVVNVYEPSPPPAGSDYKFKAWKLICKDDVIRAAVTMDAVRHSRTWLSAEEDPRLARVLALCKTFPEFESIKPLLERAFSSKDCFHSYEYLDIYSNELLLAGVWICAPSQKELIYLWVQK